MRIATTIFRPLALSVFSAAISFCQVSAPPKPADQKFASEPYEVEELHNSLRFEADGKGQRELTMRIRVQSESAVREFGLLVYPYMASFETLDVLYVRVRKADGSLVVTPSEDIQELDSAVSRQAPMYTDEREKHIAVKSVAVGDTLEVDLRWTIHDPVAPGHFWYDHNFFESGICLDEQLEFNLPANLPAKIIAGKQTPQVKEDGARRIYTLHSTHLEKAQDKDKEEVIPDWEKNFKGIAPPSVRLSSFTSWAEVGAWYSSLQQTRAQATPRIRSTADDVTKGKLTDEEKTRALYDYVSSHFRYIGIDLGSGRYTPHAAEDVLANRYGDCKDKHTLFAALLDSIGLPAYPALISTRFRLDPDFPSPSLFDHVISAMPNRDSFVFLDTTPEVAPFGLLVASIRDRQALVMPAGSPARLVTTPPNSPVPNYEKYKMDASIDSQGTLDGKARFEERGDSEVLLRTAYRNTPQNQWKELTQNISIRMGFGGTVSEVGAAQPEKTSDPFWFNYNYHRTDYSDWKEQRITLPFPPMFIPELNEAQKKSKDPLPLGPPQDIFYETSLKIPDGVFLAPPPNVEQKNDFAEYTANYKFENGVLFGTRHLTLKMREIPGAERSMYIAFAKAVEDDSQKWIFLINKTETDSRAQALIGALLPFAGSTPPESPAQKGQALLRDGKTAEAVTLLEKALADDADNEQVAFTLGKAYLKVPDDAKAVAQFQKLVASKPASYMLNDIAYEYADANIHLREAVDYASRAVADISADTMKVNLDSAVPVDFLRMQALAAYWDTLGWAKFRSDDTASAEKFLHSAWLLAPSPVKGEHLVKAYEKLGKKSEADRIRRIALGSGNTQQQLSEMRTMRVPRNVSLNGNSKIALFTIAIESGKSTATARYISGDKDLIPETKSLATLNLRQTFPNDVPVKIFRAGWVSCSKYTPDCSLVLFLVNDLASLGMVQPKPE